MFETEAHPLAHLSEFEKMTFVSIAEGQKYPTSGGWQKTPECHKEYGKSAYGVLTGRGFFIVDVDHAGGEKEGLAALDALEEKHGELPETFTVRTPTGGLHLYFLSGGEELGNGTNTLGPDIDVRGLGGQALGPGSAHPNGGTYEVENDAPIAAAPDWVLAMCRGGRSVAQPKGPPPKGVLKHQEDLKKAVGRKSAESALFWRDVVKGVFPKSLPASGWNDFLTGATHWLAHQEPDWCEVTGENIASLMGPSLSHMHAWRIERGQDLQHLGAASIASMYDRAAQKVRTEAQATALAYEAFERAKKDTSSPPKILQHKKNYYLRDPIKEAFVGPFVKDQLWAAARDLNAEGLEVHRPTPKGLVRMSPEDLMELYGRGGSLTEVVIDLTRAKAKIDGTRLLLPGAARPDIEAKPSAQIDEWLTMLGGERIKDWIAVSTDLSEAAPALWISGTPGIGKTLIVRGLAQLWGSSAAMPLEKAMDKYNSYLAQCPVVDGQERVPTTWRGSPRLDDLKSLITDTQRTIEGKYEPLITLSGAVRVVLSSNNLNMLRSSRDITAEDAEALEERLIHFHHDSPALKTYLDAIPVQKEWIDSGALASHFQHLVETRDPARGARLRLPAFDEGNALRFTMKVTTTSAFWVLKEIHAWMQVAARAEKLPQDKRIAWWAADQTVRVTASGISDRLERTEGRQGVKMIGQTLQNLSGRPRKMSTRLGDKITNMWAIPLDVIEYWLEHEGWGSAEELAEIVKCLNSHPPYE